MIRQCFLAIWQVVLCFYVCMYFMYYVFWTKVAQRFVTWSYGKIGQHFFGLKWLQIQLHQVTVWLQYVFWPKVARSYPRSSYSLIGERFLASSDSKFCYMKLQYDCFWPQVAKISTTSSYIVFFRFMGCFMLS